MFEGRPGERGNNFLNGSNEKNEKKLKTQKLKTNVF